MQSILNLSLTLLAVFALIRFVRLLTGTLRLIKMPLWAPLHTAVPRGELGELAPIFDSARIRLEQGGYTYLGTRRERPIVAIPGLPAIYVEGYYHAAMNIHAEATIADMPAPGRATVTSLRSDLDDGTVLLTTNNPLHAWQAPTTRLHECDTSDIDRMTAAHVDQRATIGVSCSVPQDPAQTGVKRAADLALAMLPGMEQANEVYRSATIGNESVYRFHSGYALNAAWKAQRRYDKVRKKIACTARTAAAIDPVLLAALFAAQRAGLVRTIGTLRGLSAPRWLQGASLLFSIPAFLGVGAWLWGWQSSCAIGVVIAFHEGGHWLAMKIAGFREVQVFFVPGFGAATVGEKHDAAPITHLLVYLAGPVPGLLVATAFFLYTVVDPDFMFIATYPMLSIGASAALFINLFNLLPVLPLDGGRVVDLFLFGRFPWLRFAFGVASALLIIAFGWRYQLTSMEVLGVIMLIASPFQFRLAKVSALWRSEAAAQSAIETVPADAIAEIVGFLSGPRFIMWNFATKLSLATAMLPRRLGATPGWRTSIGGLAIYLASIAIPLAAIGLAASSFPQQARNALRHFHVRATGESLTNRKMHNAMPGVAWTHAVGLACAPSVSGLPRSKETT